MLRLASHAIAIVVLCAAALAFTPPTFAGPERSIEGTYSDEQLAGVGAFTLPRTFLYDEDGELIPQEDWPAELAEVKRHAGDAYCCVSKTPAPPGSSGPPPDCEILVYGTEIQNFDGLVDGSGRRIAYEDLPEHRYLLVEYYATWCPPCIAGRKALDAFIATAGADEYLWLTIDMSRLPEARAAAEKSAAAGSEARRP